MCRASINHRARKQRKKRLAEWRKYQAAIIAFQTWPWQRFCEWVERGCLAMAEVMAQWAEHVGRCIDRMRSFEQMRLNLALAHSET